jgi:chromosomal replication initiator protein
MIDYFKQPEPNIYNISSIAFEINGIKKYNGRMISFDYIIKVVFNYFNIDFWKINFKTRSRKYVLPRQICHYFAKEMHLGSDRVIGKSIGNRDRTTVIHSHKTIKNLIETDSYIKYQIEEIEKLLLK